MKIAFVDCETTGLDPRIHPIWEVALILRDEYHDDEEYEWQLEVEDLAMADPRALAMSGYRERRSGRLALKTAEQFAPEFAKLTEGAFWVGAVPSFDEERLRHLLWGAGECGGWHYHLCDVEMLSAGYLAARGMAIEPPYSSANLSFCMGINPENYEAHTAIGDARWARDLYDAVMKTPAAELADEAWRREE